nr:dentin sialophosphoprotein-like [Tanacetum cinerariifolium]
MFRQSPRRNGRNKGLKIKHALQISVILGVSIWLLYQVHHSNDKKAISVETNINENPRNDSSKDMFKLGRKDIRPIVMETTIKDSKEPEEHHIDEHGTTNMEMVAKTLKAMRMGYEISQKQSINGSQKCMVKTEKDHDQSDVINDNIQIGHDREQKEDGGKEVENESGKDDTSSRNVPSVDDESQLGSSQSRNDASTNSATNSEKEKQDMEQVPNENKDDASVLEDEPYRSGNIAG